MHCAVLSDVWIHEEMLPLLHFYLMNDAIIVTTLSTKLQEIHFGFKPVNHVYCYINRP